MTIATRSIRLRFAAAAVTVLAAGAALASAVTPASADTTLHASYPVTGSTFIKAPNFTLSLGPGKLSSTVDLNTGKLTATIALPNATGTFKQFGLIPVTATTQFINDGLSTGTINLNTGAIQATSKITLRIVSLSVAGVPVPVGNSCQTKAPVVVNLASQPGFNVLDGGKLAGGYTIGRFSGCGLATLLINLTIPGSGNTISLKLGKATIG